MSKKQKKIDANLTDTNQNKQDQITQGNVSVDSKKNDKYKDKKQDKKQDKKKNKKESNGGIVKKTKETVSELKKVTWPTFGEVVKKTGIVIAFVIIFGLFLFGVNTLLGWLANLLITLPQ